MLKVETRKSVKFSAFVNLPEWWQKSDNDNSGNSVWL